MSDPAAEGEKILAPFAYTVEVWLDLHNALLPVTGKVLMLGSQYHVVKLLLGPTGGNIAFGSMEAGGVTFREINHQTVTLRLNWR